MKKNVKETGMNAYVMDEPRSIMRVNSKHAPGLMRKMVGQKIKIVADGRIKGINESYSKKGTRDIEIEVHKAKPMGFKKYLEKA